MSGLAQAAEGLADRQLVLVGDDHDETIFLACAADAIDGARLERLHELGRGMVVLGLAEPLARQLALPKPWRVANSRLKLGLTAPIDAASGIEGGWSPRERALTMRVAADPGSRPTDVTIPGHVYPAVVAERSFGAPAAAIELARLSGRAPAVAVCPVVDRDGRSASLRDSRGDAELRRLQVASPAELHSGWIARQAQELGVSCALPTPKGLFRASGYGRDEADPGTVALIHGDPAASERPLVHVHVACLFGDAFGSMLCQCGPELERAEAAIVRHGAGVIIYAKPEQETPAACARGERIDAVVVAGLLRAAGICALRLLGGERDSGLGEELRSCGLDVA